MSTLVAPFGKCLQSEGLAWLIGAVGCSLAAAAGPVVRQHVQWTAAAPLALANQLSLPMGGQVPCKSRYIHVKSLALAFSF